MVSVETFCMQDTFARARTRPMQPLGQAHVTIGYHVYNIFFRSQNGKNFALVR